MRKLFIFILFWYTFAADKRRSAIDMRAKQVAFYFVFSSFCTIFADMEIYFKGLFIALSTFLIIGAFHPIVIKTEYYYGTRPWWIFLILGLASISGALFVADVFWSALLGVLGASLLWSIGELFEQKQRVKKGWFPMNEKRKDDYA